MVHGRAWLVRQIDDDITNAAWRKANNSWASGLSEPSIIFLLFIKIEYPLNLLILLRYNPLLHQYSSDRSYKIPCFTSGRFT